MVSKTTLLLLASAALVDAKLNGWSDDFALVEIGMGVYRYRAICEGWGRWCDPGNCERIADAWRIDAPYGDAANYPDTWKWINLRKPGAAWVDVWRIQGETFNMYEENGNGQVQGQCQVAGEARDSNIRCGDYQYRPLIHCWQW